MKLTLQTKLNAAKDHVDKKMTIKEVSQKYKMDQSRIKYYGQLFITIERYYNNH